MCLLKYSGINCDSTTLSEYYLKTLKFNKLDSKGTAKYGLQTAYPDGTFFLLVRSPWQDDCSFAKLLASHDLFVLPGTPQEIPGYFRISSLPPKIYFLAPYLNSSSAMEYTVANSPLNFRLRPEN